MINIAKPLIGQEEKDAVMKVLDSGVIASGPVTEAFEKEFAAFVGTKHAIAVANGTAALHVALTSVGVGPGDEVVTVPFTFVATVNSILYAGATPVFADVDPATFNMDVASLREVITPKTKAVMPVHLYGLAFDVDPIRELCESKGIALVEDAAQAHGATYRGKQVGSMGDVGGFSMYPTKNMTTTEGGMITTNRDDVADLAKSIRNHGRGLATLGTYDHVRLGHNFRTTDVASAIGREQLKKLPRFNHARVANAKALDQALTGHPAIAPPIVPAGHGHVYHQYTVRTARRDDLQSHLKARGVGSGIYYPKLCFEYPHLRQFRTECPRAASLPPEVLSVPVHAGLQHADIQQVVSALTAFR